MGETYTNVLGINKHW